MIYDRMERLPQYKGLNAHLDELIDYVLGCDLQALAPGRNDVNGDLCWLNSNVAELTEETDLFERHMDYIDLQIPLEEGEIITVRPVEELNWAPSDEETRFTHGPAGLPIDMRPGTFAIFFPGDAHNCGLRKGKAVRVRKLVGKAREKG